jgi:hypothetical protein
MLRQLKTHLGDWGGLPGVLHLELFDLSEI